ncbi:PREDICTED: VQ motif-containing protein 22-like [Tarenaya hassleriana]|uniref:VQ motif-containing protein 22-like n=1 Tax=Tarenaya hassleriana TaxID=28532 RepID=UPI00053C63BA|nr:PREDICTED: VQ motif-containing protein 22-like [Tarenaya hassleriana]
MANNPNDWSQFYNNQSLFTTTASAAGDSRLSPETGRVSKPARRRPRASRRTPTPLLNTNTTNFRAMVQQFTGGPTAMAFVSGPSPDPGFTLTPPSLNPPLGLGGNGDGGGDSLVPPPWPYTFQQQIAHAPPQTRPYMYNNVMGVVGGVNANAEVAEDGDVSGGGEGGSVLRPSQVLGSRNGNSSSWLQ